ncbi:MAG: HEAT repeat domain-containing protein [Candidatus Brocadiia bacterium]
MKRRLVGLGIVAMAAMVSLGGEPSDLPPEVEQTLQNESEGYASYLIERLRTDPDPRKRAGAAFALGGGVFGVRHTPEVTAALLEALEDSDEHVRAMALRSFGNLDVESKDAVSAVTRLLDDPAPKVREVAAAVLPQVGEPSEEAMQALRRLAERASGMDSVQARYALLLLSKESGPHLRALLETAGSADHPHDRSHAIRLLGGLSNETLAPVMEKFIAVLLEATGSENGTVAGTAAVALREVPVEADRAVPVLLALAQRPDSEPEDVIYARVMALGSLLRFEERKDTIAPALVDLARKNVGQGAPPVAGTALTHLGIWDVRTPEVLGLVERAVRAENEELRDSAFLYLGYVSDPPVQFLRPALAARGQSRRGSSLVDAYLARLHDTQDDFRDKVLAATKSPDAAVRAGAAQTLWIEFQELTAPMNQALLRMLKDEDIRVTKAAARAFRRLGAPPEALPSLRELKGRLQQQLAGDTENPEPYRQALEYVTEALKEAPAE